MSESKTFKCPSCGAYLEYDPSKGAMTCPFCGNTIGVEDARPAPETAEAQPGSGSGSVRGYHCSNCGAEVVVGDTTAATRCYYCHSPVVILDRLRDDFQPELVIPFDVNAAKAEETFESYLNKKRFVDRRFFTKEQRESISGVYYPYWLGTVEAQAETNGTAKRVKSYVAGKYQITETDTYAIHRQGSIRVNGMYRKALQSVSRLLSDGIFPYHFKDAVPFKPDYLSGFMAEMRDVPDTDAASDMIREVEGGANQIMNHDLNYTSVSTHTSLSDVSSRLRYALLPAWVLTYKGSARGGDAKPYYFMMNGQTGTTCGKLPVNRKKLFLTCLIAGAAVAALGMLGGVLLW